MKWIELHIKCKNDPENIEVLREMGVEVEEKTEFRPLYLNIEAVDALYPNQEGGCFLFVGGDELTVREGYNKVKDMITSHLE